MNRSTAHRLVASLIGLFGTDDEGFETLSDHRIGAPGEHRDSDPHAFKRAEKKRARRAARRLREREATAQGRAR